MNVNVQLSELDGQPGLAGLVEFCELIGEPLAPAREADRPRVLRAGTGDLRDPPPRQREDHARGEDRRPPPLSVPGRDGHDRRRLPRSGADLLRADARLRAAPRARRTSSRPPPRAAPRGRRRAPPRRPLRRPARPRPLARRSTSATRSGRGPPSGELLEAMQTGLIKRRDSKLLADLHRRGAARQPARPAPRPRARAADREAHRRRRRSQGRPALARMVRPRRRRPRRPGRGQGRRTRRRGSPSRTCAASAPRSPTPRSRSSTPAAGASARAPGSRPGAWQACVGDPDFTPGEDVWIGVDVGGERSATAVVWVNDASRRRARSTTATAASSRPSTTSARSPAATTSASWSTTRGGSGRPRRNSSAKGMLVRRVPAARRAHDPRLARASTPRSSSSASRSPTTPSSPATPPTRSPATPAAAGGSTSRTPASNIDAMIALAMAVDRAEHKPAPVELLGWL